MFVVGALGACGAAGSGEVEVVPDTAGDPLPYTPPATGVPGPGGVVGISLGGGGDLSRAMAIRYLRAIRDADATALTELLADPLARAFPRPSLRRIPRDMAIQEITQLRMNAPIAPETPLEILVRVDDIDTMPLGEFLEGRNPPEGLLTTDTVVRIPLTVRGMQSHLSERWGRQGGAVIVRGGSDPRVVGY